MLNRNTTTKSWMVASLLAATSVFAQDSNNAQAPATKCRPQKSYEQGHELTASQMMAAYNAPARIDVRGAWDFYATGSFIYWQPTQENMELGIAVPNGTIALVSTTATQNPGSVVNMNFNYKPGFKVGLGMNFDYDNWDGYAEYTWFHGTNSQSSNTQGDTGAIWLFGYSPSVLNSGNFVANAVSESWKLKMDFADVQLARSYYVGTKLSFRPFVGARGAWIRQRANYAASLNTALAFSQGTGTATSGRSVSSNQNSTSWGVGPSLGLDTNWMLGYGLRIAGKAETDLLYTRYTTRTSELAFTTATGAILGQEQVKQKHVAYLRPHANLEMGFGWGSYFDNNNWHFDLLATYGFQVFWNQNMFRHFTTTPTTSQAISNVPNGDLYVQGLNLTARLDF